MTLCFQKEVAERLCAPPHTHWRSRLSVMAQAYTHAKPAFVLPSTAFVPAPKVQSMVVNFVPRSTLSPGIASLTFDELESVVKKGFSHRLKKMGAPFRDTMARQDVEAMLQDIGLHANARPFNLTVDQWAQFALALRKYHSHDT